VLNKYESMNEDVIIDFGLNQQELHFSLTVTLPPEQLGHLDQ
jgi:hypothetical protein